MTKLFSMKSLAFAGAAAFALTLAAAPQADAAKMNLNVSDLSKVTVADANGNKLTETDDGKVIYYQLLKNKDEFDSQSGKTAKHKASKYVAITDEGLGYYNLSSLAGNGKYLAISPDGTVENATGVAIKKAPKLTAKYDGSKTDVKDRLILYIGDDSKSKTAATITTGASVTATDSNGVKYEVKGVDGDLKDITSASVIGDTLELTVTEIGSTDGVAAESKPAKLKISARAKAPKVSLKLDATKAFSFKFGDKLVYKVQGEILGQQYKSTEWVASGKTDPAKDWKTIISGAKLSGLDDEKISKIVSGDAITTDIVLNFRTPASGNKGASAITVVKLAKSVDSPTGAALDVKTVKAELKTDSRGTTVKTATSASITIPKELPTIQYGEEVTKSGKTEIQWKTSKPVTGDKKREIKFKISKTDTGVKTMFIRYAGESKDKFVLPSLVTTVEVNCDTGVATMNSVKYNGEDIVAESSTVDPVAPSAD